MVDLMTKVINSYVKSIGIKMILSNDVIYGFITIIRMNWIGGDDRYYSLLVPFNETTIFDASDCTVQYTNMSFVSMLKKNTRIFDSKDEWMQGVWSKDYATKYSSNLKNGLISNVVTSKVFGNYKVLEIIPYVKPCIGFTFWYEKLDTNEINAITVWRGAITKVYTEDLNLHQLISDLGLVDSIQLISITKQQPLQIECFE